MTYQTIAYTPPTDALFSMGTLRATSTALIALRRAGWLVPDVLRQHGTGDFGHHDTSDGDAPFNPSNPPADEQLCSVLDLETPNHGSLVICLVTNIARTETRLMLLDEFA